MNQYRMLPEPNGELASMEKGVMLLHIILHTLNLVSGDGTTPSSRKNSHPCTDSNRRWLIEEYIADNCMHTGGLKELAKMLYLSERQTRTLVWKTLGKNYKDLVIQQRMELANFLLKDFSQTLEDISLKVGYRSYSGFYLAYTKYYGISPDVERQKYKS